MPMRRILAAFSSVLGLALSPLAFAQDEIIFDQNVPEIDGYVDQCLDQKGVGFLPETDVICYNAAIFPEEFLKLNELGPASRIIITSPGGNVATARGMSGILDRRAEPVTIAGPCMSACAMVILPGLDQVHIHHTAHIAVHGIAMMPFRRWYGWLNEDTEPGSLAILQAQMGYNFPFMVHQSGTTHMKQHLADQGVERAFIDLISTSMEADARAFSLCRVKTDQYWGIVTPAHVKAFLGERIIRMEQFVSSWEEPLNAPYRHIGVPVSDQTYIMKPDFEAGDCQKAPD